jgi:hypothetical protein
MPQTPRPTELDSVEPRCRPDLLARLKELARQMNELADLPDAGPTGGVGDE